MYVLIVIEKNVTGVMPMPKTGNTDFQVHNFFYIVRIYPISFPESM